MSNSLLPYDIQRIGWLVFLVYLANAQDGLDAHLSDFFGGSPRLTWCAFRCRWKRLSVEPALQVLSAILTDDSYILAMKAQVTSKGQVTIPKELRDRFGIEPGAQIDFAAREDGIRLRKVVDRRKQRRVLGCLKTELEGRSVADLLEELRGPVELPKGR